MDRVMFWVWFLFTPEESILSSSHDIQFNFVAGSSGCAGRLKAIFWIVVAIAVSCAIACLHS